VAEKKWEEDKKEKAATAAMAKKKREEETKLELYKKSETKKSELERAQQVKAVNDEHQGSDKWRRELLYLAPIFPLSSTEPIRRGMKYDSSKRGDEDRYDKFKVETEKKDFKAIIKSTTIRSSSTKITLLLFEVSLFVVFRLSLFNRSKFSINKSVKC
ncbi:MAG: hypothetical protein ACI90V_005904, partial [Bacillariaceae sp.]|jgi:hypothetical protein